MTLLEEIDVDAERETSAPCLRPWFIAGLLLLCGLLILAHGCHGNDDNELFAHSEPLPSGSGPPAP